MDLNRIARPIALVAVLLLGSACVVGNTVDFTAQEPALTTTTEQDVVVAVLDQRIYVVDGDKAPNFVGLRRGGYGVPFDVTTRSGGALADEIAMSIVRGLEANGITARAIPVEPHADPRTAIDAAIAAGADRSLVILIGEWKSDLMYNMELDFDLVAQVLDGSGTLLAENHELGNDVLGSVTWESELSEAATGALKRKLEDLLNNQSIVVALE